ncbi:hypothetical protein C1A40_06425 [Tamlana carrageenivorans]|uniref:DUF4595 domain-containing protein n=2 Tax=Pseudotamlana carrageenivorans TaxID=2069432 RepID=A0A2I7SGT6_9FLAO|nr:hypothetical protein C1A40_06425 [Tamlana carrageenivorans]
MKKQFLKLSLVMLGLVSVSCSSEETSDEKENNTDETQKYITSIKKQNSNDWEVSTQFIYENDKLKYTFLDDCSGELNYYEYNSKGKISKSYRGNIQLAEETFNPDVFDLEAFINHDYTQVLKYYYEDDTLIRIQKDESFIDYQFTYYDDGKLQTVEWFIDGVGLWEKLTFDYSEGKVSKMNKKEFNTSGGTATSNYDYTFEFDDKPNPFYNLVENYNLMFQYTCTGFDYISSEDMGLKLFKNNVKKVLRDGEEIYSATYQYDENNYPNRVSFTNTRTSGVLLLTYLK